MASIGPEPEAAVPLKTWIAVGGALIGAFMAVLNIQITNASLPDIEGGIGTGGINGAWVITAYLIGEIIVIPMTDFLSRVFSLRRYLITNTALFLCFSVACGQASSLSEMILLRALQGVLRWNADTARRHHCRCDAAGVKTSTGARRLRDHGDLRTGDRTNNRRMAHGQLRLADNLLHQYCSGSRNAGCADLRPAPLADAAGTAPAWRLDRDRADGYRARRFADGA